MAIFKITASGPPRAAARLSGFLMFAISQFRTRKGSVIMICHWNNSVWNTSSLKAGTMLRRYRPQSDRERADSAAVCVGIDEEKPCCGPTSGKLAERMCAAAVLDAVGGDYDAV